MADRARYTLTVDWPDSPGSRVTCTRDTLQHHLGTLTHRLAGHALHAAPVMVEIRLADDDDSQREDR